jgi:hypothetical protein
MMRSSGMTLAITSRSDPAARRCAASPTGEASQLAERGDPQPAEGSNELLGPNGPDVEGGKEGGIVFDDQNRWLTRRVGRSVFGGKRPGGEPEAESSPGEVIDLFRHPIHQRSFTAVVGDGSGNRDEEQPGLGQLEAGYQGLHRRNNRFEGDHLRTRVASDALHVGTDRLRLPSVHLQPDACSVRRRVHRNDASPLVDRLTGLSRWRPRAPQGPTRKPHA